MVLPADAGLILRIIRKIRDLDAVLPADAGLIPRIDRPCNRVILVLPADAGLILQFVLLARSL